MLNDKTQAYWVGLMTLSINLVILSTELTLGSACSLWKWLNSPEKYALQWMLRYMYGQYSVITLWWPHVFVFQRYFAIGVSYLLVPCIYVLVWMPLNVTIIESLRPLTYVYMYIYIFIIVSSAEYCFSMGLLFQWSKCFCKMFYCAIARLP